MKDGHGGKSAWWYEQRGEWFLIKTTLKDVPQEKAITLREMVGAARSEPATPAVWRQSPINYQSKYPLNDWLQLHAHRLKEPQISVFQYTEFRHFPNMMSFDIVRPNINQFTANHRIQPKEPDCLIRAPILEVGKTNLSDRILLNKTKSTEWTQSVDVN